MDRELPIVTVISLIYNTGPHVVEGIKSVQKQNYPKEKIDHIIIDDCSMDNSAQVVEDYVTSQNYQCKFIKHDTNQGINYSLNEALSHATGKYFVGCSDDISVENRFGIQVKILEDNPQYALTCCDILICDQNEKIINESYFETCGLTSKKTDSIFKELLETNLLPAPGVMYRIESLQNIGCFDLDLAYEDWDIHLRLAWKYPIHVDFENKLGIYRRVEGGFTDSRAKGNLARLESDYYIIKKWIHLNDQYNGKVKDKLITIITKKIYPVSLKKARKMFHEIKDLKGTLTPVRLYFIKFGLPFIVYRFFRKLKIVQ